MSGEARGWTLTECTSLVASSKMIEHARRAEFDRRFRELVEEDKRAAVSVCTEDGEEIYRQAPMLASKVDA